MGPEGYAQSAPLPLEREELRGPATKYFHLAVPVLVVGRRRQWNQARGSGRCPRRVGLASGGQSLIRFSQMREVIRLLWCEGYFWWVGHGLVGRVQGVQERAIE